MKAVFTALHNHPFPVVARFERSVVLTYAVPKGDLERLLPHPLQPDLWQDQTGFVAVAVVQTRSLRPAGFPAALGSDFVLLGYRAFVRYTTKAGKRLRGLYILGSETDSRRMAALGNFFTRYKYITTDISVETQGREIRILSRRSGLAATLERGDEALELPAGSPFSTWKEARRFAGPLPFTFSVLDGGKSVLAVEGQRSSWVPAPLAVQSAQVRFFEKLPVSSLRLASAFLVENIPYRWSAGKLL